MSPLSSQTPRLGGCSISRLCENFHKLLSKIIPLDRIDCGIPQWDLIFDTISTDPTVIVESFVYLFSFLCDEVILQCEFWLHSEYLSVANLRGLRSYIGNTSCGFNLDFRGLLAAFPKYFEGLTANWLSRQRWSQLQIA
jgi:hypothetical protein